MNEREALAKVPEITLGFWIIKILATTLGETGGDAVTMPPGNLGYAWGTAIFAALFLALVVAQVRAHGFRPWLYWFTIIATTTVGTTMADFADRSLGIGYLGGSSLLLALLLGSLLTWRLVLGTVAVESVASPASEAFYWVTIMFSQTLGTALGDFLADGRDEVPAGLGLGYGGSALVFGGLLAAIAVVYFATRFSRTALFWAAFILTRPLGAVVGDFLDKPIAKGGLELSRLSASLFLLAVIAFGIWALPQRAARRAH